MLSLCTINVENSQYCFECMQDAEEILEGIKPTPTLVLGSLLVHKHQLVSFYFLLPLLAVGTLSCFSLIIGSIIFF